MAAGIIIEQVYDAQLANFRANVLPAVSDEEKNVIKLTPG
jgi:hypothetical protein